MLFKLMRQYLRPYVWHSVVIVILQLCQAMAALSLPTYNADIIDHGVVAGDIPYIWRTGGIMVVMTLGQILCNIAAIALASRVAMRVGQALRKDAFDRVQSFSTKDLAAFSTASLITRATNDVLQVQTLVLFSFTVLLTAPTIGIGGVVMAVRQDLGLSTLLLVIVPVLGVAMGVFASRLQPLFKTMQGRLDAVNGVIREQLTGARVIRALVRQDTEKQRFFAVNKNLQDTSMSVGKIFALMMPTVMFIINLSSIAVIAFGGIRISSGSMQIGSLVAFLNYLMQILMAVMMAVMIILMVPRAQVSAERLTEVLNTKPSISSPPQPQPLPAAPLNFTFDQVSFTFPGAAHPVIHNINLALTPGQTTAIIGSTGSGKTTLCRLLPRLLDPSTGRVTINGVDLKDLDLEQLRATIAFVPQQPYLFAGTIASNLLAPTPEKAWEALEYAQAAEFVRATDLGLDTPVEPGGKNFSGGQRQRLTMARAFARPAQLFIFDDSFSALDYVTDSRIRATLPAATNQAACLIVAQRVSTIRHADQIIVLDNGSIAGRGKHHELMECCPTYQEIVLSQLSLEEAA